MNIAGDQFMRNMELKALSGPLPTYWIVWAPPKIRPLETPAKKKSLTVHEN